MNKHADRWLRDALLNARWTALAVGLLLLCVAAVGAGAAGYAALAAQGGVPAAGGEAGSAVAQNVSLLNSLHECRAESEALRLESQDLRKRTLEQSHTHGEAIRSVTDLQTRLQRNERECEDKIRLVKKRARMGQASDGSNLEKKMQIVRDELQRISRTELRRRYGENKTIIIDMNTSKGPLSIQMAPDTLMPYVTFWFVNLVERGFWDGCSFSRGASHVLQANCMHNPLKTEHPSIAFQEYTPKYPHKVLTVGLAGFPGGPDWYINLVDNVRNHGPGGQGPEANSCFGKVIAGFETVEAMKKVPTEPTGWQAMKEPVTIHTAKVRTE